MINRRHTRPSKAVENLQQFCINNSAGVDCTKPHNDVKSVYSAKNLVNNPDGSLSLRRPLILRNQYGSDAVKVFPTGVGDVVVVIRRIVDGRTYLDICDGTPVGTAPAFKSIPFRLVWNDYQGKEFSYVADNKTVFLYSSAIDFKDASAMEAGGGTLILSNCVVDLFAEYLLTGENVPNANLCNKTLYPTSVTCPRPRYVQVYYDSAAKTNEMSGWTVRLISPEMNEYRFDGDAVVHDVNTLLDNPFAVRDTYDAAVPGVKTIRPYVYSYTQGTEIVPYSATNVPNGTTVSSATELLTFKDFTYCMLKNFPESTALYAEYTPTLSKERLYKDAFWEVTHACKLFVTVYYTTDLKVDYISFVKHLKYRSKRTPLGLSKNAQCTLKSMPQIHGTVGFGLEEDRNFFRLENMSWELSSGTESVVSNECEVSCYYRYTFIPYRPSSLREYLESKDVLSNKFFNVYYNLSIPETEVTVEYVADNTALDTITVAQLTESTLDARYRACTSINPTAHNIVLKAFTNVPRDTSNLYCTWKYSTDGVHWFPVPEIFERPVTKVSVKEPSNEPVKDVSVTDTSASEEEFKYIPFGNPTPDALCLARGDCTVLAHNAVDEYDYWNGALFKFKICAIDTSGTPKITATYGETLFTLPMSAEFEFEESKHGNTATGEKRYLNKRIFSFGSPLFKNNVFYSYPGEFTTPLTNAITLAASADDIVTSVSSWRNYIVSATPHAMYLSSPSENGYFTKTVNTAIGVPEEDRQCVAAAPTGVIFKSGTKVYVLYPNAYASDDTYMNVTDISKQVSHILEDYVVDVYHPFAFTTGSEYVLALPTSDKTVVLRYDLGYSRWNVCEYPVVFEDVRIRAFEDIRVQGHVANTDVQTCEYAYDVDLKTHPTFSTAYHDAMPYADVVSYDGEEFPLKHIVNIMREHTDSKLQNRLKRSAIAFELDTGQKTDTILTTKQFVESKFVVATLHAFDAFPMQLTVHIDGCAHLVTRDISTDAPFWKSANTSGVLNTTVYGKDIFNTLRQMIVRYSGKGKTIRHILTGSSLCNFKLYETYIRYKLLNTKQ